MVAASPESVPTLAFASEGKLTGSTGCNSFSGSYTSSGSKLTITLGAMTQRACVDPVLNAQESAIVEQLSKVTAYTISDDVLSLTGSGGTQLFTYKAAATSLTGSAWNVTGVNNGKGAVESTTLTEKLTANFGENGSFSGFGGCNQLNGSYKLSGTNGLSIGPLMSTKKTCGTAIDQLEAQYSAALDHVANYEINGATLTLRDNSNAAQVVAHRS